VATATPSATKRPRAAAAVEEAEGDTGAAAAAAAEEGASAAAAAAPAPSRSRRSGGGGAAAAAVEIEEGASVAAAAAPAPGHSRRGGGGGSGGAATAAAVEAEEDTGAATAAPAPSRSSRRGGGGGGGAAGGRGERMTIYQLRPFDCIGPARLGLTRDGMQSAISETPEREDNQDYFSKSCLRVDYDPETNEAVYITALDPIKVDYEGTLIFQVSSKKLFRQMKEIDPKTTIEDDQILSKKLGIMLYCSNYVDHPSWPPTQVSIFFKGYYSKKYQKKLEPYSEERIDKMHAEYIKFLLDNDK